MSDETNLALKLVGAFLCSVAWGLVVLGSESSLVVRSLQVGAAVFLTIVALMDG